MFKLTFVSAKGTRKISDVTFLQDDNEYFYILKKPREPYPIYVDKDIWRLVDVQVQK